MKPARHPARLAAALALSAVLHAGLALLLAAGERPSVPPEERLEVRLVQVEEPGPAPAAASAPAAARRETKAALSPTPTSTPIPTPTPIDGPPGSAEWLARRGLEPAEGSGVSLALSWRAGGRPGEGVGGAGGEVSGGGESRERGSAAVAAEAKRNVDAWFRDHAAAERARNPDGYWSGVGQRLARGFSPGWDVLVGTQGGLLSRGQLRALAEAWKGYQEVAARYGATGSLQPGEPGLAAGPGPGGSLAGDALALAFHRELVTLVRIRQAPDGRVSGVELARTSGNAEHDRRALQRVEALRAEAEPSLGPTPPQGRETLWAFATSFDMVPPVPLLGLSFDAWFRPDDVTWPLKKSSRSSVELRAVY